MITNKVQVIRKKKKYTIFCSKHLLDSLNTYNCSEICFTKSFLGLHKKSAAVKLTRNKKTTKSIRNFIMDTLKKGDPVHPNANQSTIIFLLSKTERTLSMGNFLYSCLFTYTRYNLVLLSEIFALTLHL